MGDPRDQLIDKLYKNTLTNNNNWLRYTLNKVAKKWPCDTAEKMALVAYEALYSEQSIDDNVGKISVKENPDKAVIELIVSLADGREFTLVRIARSIIDHVPDITVINLDSTLTGKEAKPVDNFTGLEINLHAEKIQMNS